MSSIFLALIAILLIIFLALLDWRRSIKAVLFLVIIEGALRKWAIPQASQFIYFLKDFVLLGAYLRYFLLSSTQIKFFNQKPFIFVLTASIFIWGICQAFNPSLGSPIIGVFGLKNYFLYLPLIWLVPQLFNSEEELYRFLRSYLLLLIPVGLLAIAQFFSPSTSPLNVYAWGDEGPDVVVSGLGTVRVTGTFSYIAGYTTYLLAALCLLLPMLSRPQPKLWQLLTLIEIVLVAATSFMTGSRGVILGGVLLVLGYMGLQALIDFSNFFRSTRKLLIPGVVGFLAVSYGFRYAVESFWARVTGVNDSVSGRILNSLVQPFTNFQLKGLDGYGLGATFQANRMIRQIFQLPAGEMIPVGYESEMGRIALEIGPIGFFLWYGLRFLLLYTLFKTYCKLTHPFLRQLALSAFVYQGVTFISQIVYNHTANVYHWFFYGFIFLLPSLERIAQWQQAQTAISFHDYSAHFSHPSHE